MEKVLFICGHNSGRSQIAEACLKQLAGNRYEAYSAGLEPSDSVNRLVVEVMKEDGIDLSSKRPRAAFDLFKAGELFDYVITVCDRETDEKCPVYPGIQRREHWPFPDPEKLTGTYDEKLEKVRGLRDKIKEKITRYFSL